LYYPGFFGLDYKELFPYVWDVDVEYYFMIDALLMKASKGGIPIESCRKMGPREKDKFIEAYGKIAKAESDNSGSSDSEVKTNENV
jgi:hypothetical protein